MKALLIFLAFNGVDAPVVYNQALVYPQAKCDEQRAPGSNAYTMATNHYKGIGVTTDKVVGVCVPFTDAQIGFFNTTAKRAGE